MNDELSQAIQPKLMPTPIGPVFMNNMACTLGINDKLRDIARDLFIEVSHKLKRPVPNIEIALNEMCDARRHCACIESSKAEMLDALWLNYGLKEEADDMFAKARDNCLAARETAKKTTPRAVVPTQDEFKTVLNAIDNLRTAVSALMWKFDLNRK